MGLLNQKCINFNTEEGEIWMDIPGFPNYKVSNHGRVASFRGNTPKLLRPSVSRYGYLQVSVISGEKFGTGKKSTIAVHRLVALAFIPNPENKPCIDHINTIKTANFPENLRWVSYKENANNPITLEHMDDVRPLIKEKCAHKVYVYDEELNELSSFTSTKDAAIEVNGNQGNISSCCMGSLPRYRGLIWSYTRLSSMEDRKALEASVKEKFNRNRASTVFATKKWQNVHREKYNQRCKDYYHQHREEILMRRRERYGKKAEEQ
jgi:hypothetical protein